MARLSGLMLKGGIDKTMLDLVRPVNSLYLTVGSEDPNTVFGGTWVKLTGGVLACAGTAGYAAAGAVGGSKKISVGQMPSHIHSGTRSVTTTLRENVEGSENFALSGVVEDSLYTFDAWTNATGGGQPQCSPVRGGGALCGLTSPDTAATAPSSRTASTSRRRTSTRRPIGPAPRGASTGKTGSCSAQVRRTPEGRPVARRPISSPSRRCMMAGDPVDSDVMHLAGGAVAQQHAPVPRRVHVGAHRVASSGGGLHG